MRYSVPSFLNVTAPLHCFYRGCIQSNQQLAGSQLMHSIHYISAVYPYQVRERRPAQDTLIGCAELHNKIFEGIEYLLSIL
jgi:hypothetical protein